MQNIWGQNILFKPMLYLCLICILILSCAKSLSAKEIAIVRPLQSSIEDEKSRKTKTIPEALYHKLLNSSVLYLFDPLNDELELNPDLKKDYLTILETAFVRLGQHSQKRFSEREEKSLRFRKAFQRHGQQNYFSSMESIYESLKYSIFDSQPEVEQSNGESLTFDDLAYQIYQAMQDIPIMMALLIKVDDLSLQDPDTYQNLKEAFFEIFRREILNFDRQIKIVSKINEEVAQRLAVGFIEIVLNSHAPQTPKIFSSLFQPIEDKQIINTMADQYITRVSKWFFGRVVRKFRVSSFYVFAFGASVWAGSYLMGAEVTREAYYDFIGYVLPMSFVIWGGEFVGLKLSAMLAPKLDYLLNSLRSLRYKNKEGPLFKEAKAHGEFHIRSCSDLFEKSL